LASDPEIQRIAAAALAEDGDTDLTTLVSIPPHATGRGLIEYRTDGILAGTRFAEAVAQLCHCSVEWAASEGASVRAGTMVGRVTGPLREILRAERPFLNLLQRAGGIATATRRYVEAVAGSGARILHTRKTAPGLRALDVAAVVAGGGHRHRLDLAHEVMIKDNHWQSLAREGGDLKAILSEAGRRGARGLYVEVESVEQLEAACAAGATRLLIDNQSPATLRSWALVARRLRPDIEIEATGGIQLDNVRAYADAGADFISVGALTHSVRAADVSLEVKIDK
jgi:nicotinate-nucleotide pyrophosphorylase (carboxylating)